VVLIQIHGKAFDQKLHLENLVRINHDELAFLKGNYNNQHAGLEYSDPQHPYAHDLDLFGEGSLFQYSNRCNTLDGRKKFAQSLLAPRSSKEAILERQKAVHELASLLDFRQHVQASGMEIEELPSDRAQLAQWTKQPANFFGKKVYASIFVIAPLLTIGFIIGAFFLSALMPLAIGFALFQWVFLGIHIKKVNEFHAYISRKKNVLVKYAKLLSLLDNSEFNSSELRKLNDSAHAAGVSIRELASLVNALDARMNWMMSLFVNTVLMYDLQCIYRLEKWKAQHADKLELWLDTATETEVLVSWATFAYNHPEFTFAQIDDTLAISAEAMGHPLIQNNCVVNDVRIGENQRIQIITGANMAGKSTFLRSIGVNLVLALAGAPVCAQKFTCSVVGLRTGMRATDSLKDHQSYFYAELNRLKAIVDELQQNKPLLILLDEILKGTNSTDKLYGSIELVKQLIPHPCLALIATHDLALGELEKTQSQAVRNFCFEASIKDDQLSFDYKLKSGLAQTMNATFLMKKMGIIPA
jgi:DNA mismatch repair ATPase MutS